MLTGHRSLAYVSKKESCVGIKFLPSSVGGNCEGDSVYIQVVYIPRVIVRVYTN